MPKLCPGVQNTVITIRLRAILCWCESYSCRVMFTKNRGLPWLHIILNLGLEHNIGLIEQQCQVQSLRQADWCYYEICVLGHKYTKSPKKRIKWPINLYHVYDFIFMGFFSKQRRLGLDSILIRVIAYQGLTNGFSE